MKFEIGKEYVGDNAGRIRVIAANDWGAAFEYLSLQYAGQYGACSNRGHTWRPAPRPAPRAVERWIVITPGSQRGFVYQNQAAAVAMALGAAGVVAGPFTVEVPW